MARDTRGWYTYVADNHGAQFDTYEFAVLTTVDTASEAGRGWVASAAGQDTLPKRLKPRHVIGRDVDGNSAHAIVATTGAQLWDGTLASFTVNGVSYNITGYVGEKRTAVAP
jgi:hypothetical protein